MIGPFRSKPVPVAPRRRRRAGGFTLIEVLIIIGIIGLLASLTLAVTRQFITQAEIRDSQATLRLIDAALHEWEALADRSLLWWDARDDVALRDRADVHGDVPDIYIITEVLETIRRSREARSLLAAIPPHALHTYRAGEVPKWIKYQDQFWYGEFLDQLTAVDAWETPIYATHPGRLWRPEDAAIFGEPDEDGTICTDNERRYGTAPNRQVVFVSAGPDRRFGIPTEFKSVYGEDLSDALDDARADNIYSVAVTFRTDPR